MSRSPFRARLTAVALAAAAVCAIAGAARADDVGMVKVAKGDVQIERGGQRIPAAVGSRVRQGDVLVTGAGASAGVAFVDNSLLSTGPNTRLVIDRFTFDRTTHAGSFEASLNQGTLAVVTGKIAKQSPDAMKVRTPAAVLGARGTEFLARATGPAR